MRAFDSLVLLAAIAGSLRAQRTAPAPGGRPDVPTVVAARAIGPIRIDGSLDEPAWAAAVPATQFTQTDPNPGAAPTRRTEVRVLIGHDALYLGARMFDDPADVRPRLARKDEPVDGDIFAVSLDSRHDHLTAYYFRVTAGGALRDAIVTPATGEGRPDISWDAVWDAAVSRDSLGWVVEMRIPLSQLPYNRTSDPVWGIQFERYGWNRQERDLFAYTPKTEAGGVQRYGHLIGLGPLPAPNRLELVPYASTRAEYLRETPGDPFRSGGDYFERYGVDLKYRVTSSLTLNATVNPDFGQVEVDPAVVNLTAFETFFPEKRPFFVEGADLFQFGQLRAFNSYGFSSLFFSRRIGRAPSRDLVGPGYASVDAPAQTTILSAEKLTGKTISGWSIAALDAVTGRTAARYLDNLGAPQEATVEPLTNYLVGRIRREMNGGNTGMGAIFTAANRTLTDSVLASVLRSGAYIAGVDLNHAWANRAWLLDASSAGSFIHGSAGAITLSQKASSRYFQRPDARSFQVDSGRTSLAGHSGQIALTKAAGLHWLGSLALQESSPGFEANDLGFETNTDRRALSTDVEYQETSPGPAFLTWNVSGFTNQTWNSDGDIVFNNYALFGEGQFRDFAGMFARLDASRATLDDRLTRGGPLAVKPAGWAAQVGFFPDQRKLVTPNVTLQHAADRGGLRSDNLQVTVDYQATPTLRFSFGPSYALLHDPGQYVAAAGDARATETYGVRYLFATLAQTTTAFVTRAAWTLTPRLSCQLYAQPFVAAGRFDRFKELRAPRTFAFTVYGQDAGMVRRDSGTVTIDPTGSTPPSSQIRLGDPNFNLRSLRGNAVLRWEYRPGSTIFVVWQQTRSDLAPFGDFAASRDYAALFRLRPDNIFAVKATFWLGR